MAAGISIGLASQHPPQLNPPPDPTQYGKTLTTTTSSSSRGQEVEAKDSALADHGPFETSYGTAVLLTDIQGSEDHLGDMDFKIAGTAVGITAVQLDTKLPGVDLEVLVAALKPAVRARVQLLGEMEGAVGGYEMEVGAEMRARHGVVAINKELVPRLVGLHVSDTLGEKEGYWGTGGEVRGGGGGRRVIGVALVYQCAVFENVQT